MSTTATPEAPAAEAAKQEPAQDSGDSSNLAEALREEITPIKGATVVNAGGRKVTTTRKASGSRKKATTAKKTTGSRKRTAAGSKPKKVSTLAAAEIVLKRASGPLHVSEITKRILAMPDTGLKGKTPEASVGAILAVNAKKRDSSFKRTAPSTYTLKEKK